MISIEHSKVYLKEEHEKELKNEPAYVRKRYYIIAWMITEKPMGIPRREGAKILGISIRHVYRILKRFKEKGIPGLRFRSRRPRTMPKLSPRWFEEAIIGLREATGFSPQYLATLLNEGYKYNRLRKRVGPSTIHKILVRNGVIEQEEKPKKDWKKFDWKRPNNLIQADITMFNNIPILTMEDDHTRKGWAMVICDQTANTVSVGMGRLVPHEYNNLLTDNGKQFRDNPEIIQYRNRYVKKKHIFASVRHPQTLGKISAYQKGLKRFLRRQMGESGNRSLMMKYIRIYNLWYNNGKYHSVIKGYLEEKYSGERDEKWFQKLMTKLKLWKSICPPERGG